MVGDKPESAPSGGERLVVLIGAGISLLASVVALVAFLKRWSPLMDKQISQKSADRGESGGLRDTHSALSMSNITLSRVIGKSLIYDTIFTYLMLLIVNVGFWTKGIIAITVGILCLEKIMNFWW